MNPADNVLVIAGISIPLNAADTNVILDSVENSTDLGTDFDSLFKRLKPVVEAWSQTPEFKAELEKAEVEFPA